MAPLNQSKITLIVCFRDDNSMRNILNSAYYIFCLFVCLYPINVKTAEPIGPKLCVIPHMTPCRLI